MSDYLFRVVIADPPWSFGDKLTMSDVKRGADANYATMTVDDIALLNVSDWCLPDALLALWVPSAMLADGLRVMTAWGFAQKQVYTWVKTSKHGQGLAFGMGRYFRGCTEHALIGTRGKVAGLVVSHSARNAEMSTVLSHSQKPDGLHERLEEMFPICRRLELFARRARSGWTCFGNEAPGYQGQDVRNWSPLGDATP